MSTPRDKTAAPHRVGRLLLLLLLLPVPRALCAFEAPQGYSRRLFGLAAGLPEQTVQTITQTSDHNLWIGTTGGLVRFDGTRFVTFDRENTPQLHANSIFCLLAAHDGSLWIGTEGSGLLRYSHGAFRAFGGADGLSDLFVRALAQDSQGNIWIGTNNGLFRIHDPSAKVSVERMDARGDFPSLAINAIFQDSRGRLWLGGSRLMVVEKGTPHFYDLPGDRARNRVKSIAETRRGTLWVGTVSGLYRISPGASGFAQVSAVRGTARALKATSDGRLWVSVVGQETEAFSLDDDDNLLDKQVIPSDTALGIYEDFEKNVWLGTETGLLRLTRTPLTVLSLPQAGESDFGTVYLDRTDTLWFGSTQLFKSRNGQLTPVQIPGVAGVRIRNVLQVTDGSYWFGTDGAGLYHSIGTAVQHYTTANGLVNNFVRAMIQARDGSIWVGTDEGVSHFDGAKFVNLGMKDGLAYQSIRSLLQDRNGDLWIGTELGLSHLRGGGFLVDDAVSQLRQDKVWALHEDDGGLWIGTRNNGLFLSHAGKLAHFGLSEGLASESIYDIEEDGQARFWLSGPAGISQLNRHELEQLASGKQKSLSLAFYSTSNDATATQIFGGMQSAGAITPQGEVWFPTNHGPIRVTPSVIVDNAPPPAQVTKVMADGRELPLEGGIRLSPGDTRLEISYSAVMLRPQDSIRFKYKLEGFDTDWVAADRRHTAEYTNVRPGKYVFQVAAYNLDHPDLLSVVSLTVAKSPHFYTTWWFLLACVLLFSGLCLAAYRSRIAHLRKRFDAVLAERARLAREVHDTLLQGCAGISVVLEAVSTLRSDESGLRQTLLDTARTQMRSTMNEARDAIWSLRHDQDTLQNLTTLMDRMGTQLSTDLGVAIRCRAEGEPYPVSYGFAHELLMVVREAVHNAANHADPSQIELSIGYQSQSLDIGVVDDGCGFTPGETDTHENHFGLLGMKERVGRLGGTFVLESAPAAGTAIKIHLPLTSSLLRGVPGGA